MVSPVRPRRQRGVALITVLLVVALATAAAAAMTRQHFYDVRRTSNQLAQSQAHAIALGGETWAMDVLRQDRRGTDPDASRDDDEASSETDEDEQDRHANIDSRDEKWARPLPSIPVEGGQVTGRITDAQGRFNVNNLVNGKRVNAIALARFERLLKAVQIDPEVAQAVVDWIDADRQVSYPGGAEDDFYASRKPPYRSANRRLVAASALRQVRGITAKAWRRLRPHVTALPTATALNINTADPVVLQAIVPELEREAARRLFELAGDKPFRDVQELARSPLVKKDELETDGLGVSSHHFRVRADVHVGPLQYTLYSWLIRGDNGACRVLRRARTRD